MLEDVAGNDEIETADKIVWHGGNIEPRLLMKEGIRVVELVAEPPGIVIRIREPHTDEIATPRQLRNSHAPAEQLGGKQVNDGPVPHR